MKDFYSLIILLFCSLDLFPFTSSSFFPSLVCFNFFFLRPSRSKLSMFFSFSLFLANLYSSTILLSLPWSVPLYLLSFPFPFLLCFSLFFLRPSRSQLSPNFISFTLFLPDLYSPIALILLPCSLLPSLILLRLFISSLTFSHFILTFTCYSLVPHRVRCPFTFFLTLWLYFLLLLLPPRSLLCSSSLPLITLSFPSPRVTRARGSRAGLIWCGTQSRRPRPLEYLMGPGQVPAGPPPLGRL